MDRARHRDGLPPELVAQLPELDPDHVIALGPRDAAELAAYHIDSLAASIAIFRDDHLRGHAGAVAEVAVQRFRTAGRRWWLHIDLDVLSTDALPAVDYPQPGGLDWADLAAITDAGLVTGCLGLSVVIYNPNLDPDQRHTHAIVEHLCRALSLAESAGT